MLRNKSLLYFSSKRSYCSKSSDDSIIDFKTFDFLPCCFSPDQTKRENSGNPYRTFNYYEESQFSLITFSSETCSRFTFPLSAFFFGFQLSTGGSCCEKRDKQLESEDLDLNLGWGWGRAGGEEKIQTEFKSCHFWLLLYISDI